MTVEELTELFAKRDAELAAQNAEYKAAQEKRDAELAAQNAEYNKRFAAQEKRDAELDERIDKLVIAVAETRATVNELGKSVSETRATVNELSKSVNELGKSVNELSKSVSETRATVEKLSITVARTEKLVGNLTNKFGDFFERLMIPGIMEKFNEKGFRFDTISTNVEFLKDKDGSTITEVDAILENGKYVVLIETKAELRNKHVDEHLKSISLLRKNGKFKGKHIYGAISCGYSRKPALEYGLKSGLFMLRQPDTFAVEIADFPKGYSAKAW
jgi:uncharacterized coiled-coil protein SlyX